MSGGWWHTSIMLRQSGSRVDRFGFGVVFVCFLVISSVNGQAEIGDLCTFLNTNKPGECVLLKDCQQALVNLQQKQMFPQICGYSGTAPIVCCEKAEVPTLQTRVAGDISKQKCREYAKAVIVRFKPPTLSFDSNDYVEENKCTFVAVPLVVGGTNASEAEFPHMALIGFETPDGIKWQCGGTLISEQYVLTAGHCLFSQDFGGAKYVRLGVTNINDVRHRQQFTIAERVRHPDFKPPSHYHDIALLKLNRTVNFTPYLRPACLYTTQGISKARAIATGWGKTDFTQEGSDNLLKVTLDFIDQPRCNSSFKRQIGRKLDKGISEETQVCAGSFTEKKDTCQGDSGGPLQIYGEGEDIRCTYLVVGVTSFGKPCGVVNSPGVYTRVSAYIKWLEDIVWP